MEITVLGSAHGRPTLGRYCTSLALQTAGNLYLLDCGEPCAARLAQEGLDSHKVRVAFISHMHADHASGIFMLLQEMHLTGRDSPFTLCVPSEAAQPLRSFLPAIYCAPESLGFQLSIGQMRHGSNVYTDDNLTVTAYRNSHICTGPLGEVDDQPRSFSFVIDVEGKRVVWTGDLPSSLAELGGLLTQPTDLLLCELTHIKPEALFQFLGRYEIATVLFHHVYENHFADFNDFGPMLTLAKKYLGGEVHIARDGYRLSL